MNICITGSTGRLGSVLCRHFRESGDEVIAFSQKPGAERRSISSLPEFLRGETADCVLHLAWSTLPATSETAEGHELKVDLPLLESLLAAMAERKGEKPLFVFFSTCAVYGDQSGDGAPFDEGASLHPKGFYARGKVTAERLIAQYASDCGMRALVLRVSNPYGFAQDAGCRQGVIPALMHAACSGKAIELWGSGEQTKDYLHVDDFRAAVDKAVRDNVTGVFNVASGRSIALKDVVAGVERLSGQSIRIATAPARPWDVQRGAYDNSAFRAATGWQPRIGFEEGLARFVQNSVRAES
jgi:UDP-glucose 4-epimerase